jgi:hypothetical protein
MGVIQSCTQPYPSSSICIIAAASAEITPPPPGSVPASNPRLRSRLELMLLPNNPVISRASLHVVGGCRTNL